MSLRPYCNVCGETQGASVRAVNLAEENERLRHENEGLQARLADVPRQSLPRVLMPASEWGYAPPCPDCGEEP